MKIIIQFIKDFIEKMLRHAYWLFRLMQVEKGKNLSIKFPVKVEGSGKLIFGDNCKIDKNTYFACGKDSKIIFGKNCRIDNGVEIIAGKGAEITFGNNCWIMRNTIIRTGNKYDFGDHVYIATNCAIFSRESGHEGKLSVDNGTHIGDNTIMDISDDLIIAEEIAIGPNCVIYTHDHDYTKHDKAAWKGGVVKNKVSIKSGAWIGSNVTILPGVQIAERSVIAAGGVVTKSTESNCIYGGIPAKKIKDINA